MNKYDEALTQLIMYAPIEEEPIPSQCYETLKELIDNHHTARWLNVPHANERMCSNCWHDEPYKFANTDADIYHYCPFCGAKMTGEDND